jgi:hypothetical protein
MRVDHGTFRTSGVIWESATFGPWSSRNVLEGRWGSGGTSAEIREPLCFLAYSLSSVLPPPAQPSITPLWYFYIMWQNGSDVTRQTVCNDIWNIHNYQASLWLWPFVDLTDISTMEYEFPVGLHPCLRVNFYKEVFILWKAKRDRHMFIVL